MILTLLHNLALLVALGVGLQMLARRLEDHPALRRMITGLLFGGVGVVGMMTPLRFAPGVIYDGRSIVLSLAGLFGGPVAAVVAAVMCGVYRLHLGGAGALAGVGVIIESAALGAVLHQLRKRDEAWVSLPRLWLFAILVHVIMLGLQLLIPGRGPDILAKVGLSVLTFYPPCFLIIAQVFLDGERRRKMVDTLRDNERRLRAFFEQGPDGVVVLNPKTLEILEFNDQVCRQLGYSRDEFGKLKLYDIEAVETSDQMRARIADVMSKGRAEFETLQRKKQGDLRHVQVIAQTIQITGRTIYHCIWRDVHERKVSEMEQQKLRDQLAHAQKMESVGRLAGGVAHDFNNMLQAILGNVALALEEKNLTPHLAEHLHEIQAAAHRSADLTRQLLAFARKQTVSPKVLDLNDTVAGMLKMLRRLIGEDIQLAWLPGAGLGSVRLDPSQLDQVLANLTVNARDAIGGVGKITIETGHRTVKPEDISAKEGCLPGDYLVLTVSDTGRGMDAETQSHLFEPFFTTKKMGEGTGLGLATVYGIVSQNGGFVEVESAVGQGTTFRIHFPRVEEARRAPEAGAGRAEGGRETVLLVEDEAAILKLGRRILEGLGYRVYTAGKPGDALRQAAENRERIDLLITDVIMPEMNGRELAERLRGLHPETKCLFMSGYTASAIAQHGVLEEGMHFVQKPFSPQELAVKVRGTLDDGNRAVEEQDPLCS